LSCVRTFASRVFFSPDRLFPFESLSPRREIFFLLTFPFVRENASSLVPGSPLGVPLLFSYPETFLSLRRCSWTLSTNSPSCQRKMEPYSFLLAIPRVLFFQPLRPNAQCLPLCYLSPFLFFLRLKSRDVSSCLFSLSALFAFRKLFYFTLPRCTDKYFFFSTPVTFFPFVSQFVFLLPLF